MVMGMAMMLGDDGDGRLSKAELVELIVNKLKK